MCHYRPTVESVEAAAQTLDGIVNKTPLVKSDRLSELYDAEVYLKREDLQVVRSFKIRGAFNKIAQLSSLEKSSGVVCASAGNHSQGVAYACARLAVKGTIFMPWTTPSQKVNQTKKYGGDLIEVILVGETFDDAQSAARNFQDLNHSVLIHPFDDQQVIEGQATVGLEILKDSSRPFDFLLLPLGGGGLAAGISSYFREKSSSTQLFAAEPEGAAAMKQSISAGQNISLNHINTFSDGAAVKRVGDLGFAICRETLTGVIAVPEGRICTEILKLYNDDAIVAEPAGALSIAALDSLKAEIRGKRVVCILSGGNNDIARIEDIKARSLQYEGYNVCCGQQYQLNAKKLAN